MQAAAARTCCGALHAPAARRATDRMAEASAGRAAADSARRLERNAQLQMLLSRPGLADQAAFAELYRLASPHLYAVALRILRQSAAAEDVLQQSFVSIWHHAGSYSAARSQPLTWL